MRGIPFQAVTIISSGRGNRIAEAPEVFFYFTPGDKGVETPLPKDSLKASHSPSVGGLLRSFRRDWQIEKHSNNVLSIVTNGYVLPVITNQISQSSPDSVRIQDPSRFSSCCLYPVSPVKNVIERVESLVQSLGFYSRLS